MHVFDIQTMPGGHNLGRTYRFRPCPEHDGSDNQTIWLSNLRSAVKDCKERQDALTKLSILQKMQRTAKSYHDSDLFQQVSL